MFLFHEDPCGKTRAETLCGIRCEVVSESVCARARDIVRTEEARIDASETETRLFVRLTVESCEE